MSEQAIDCALASDSSTLFDLLPIDTYRLSREGRQRRANVRLRPELPVAISSGHIDEHRDAQAQQLGVRASMQQDQAPSI